MWEANLGVLLWKRPVLQMRGWDFQMLRTQHTQHRVPSCFAHCWLFCVNQPHSFFGLITSSLQSKHCTHSAPFYLLASGGYLLYVDILTKLAILFHLVSSCTDVQHRRKEKKGFVFHLKCLLQIKKAKCLSLGCAGNLMPLWVWMLNIIPENRVFFLNSTFIILLWS